MKETDIGSYRTLIEEGNVALIQLNAIIIDVDELLKNPDDITVDIYRDVNNRINEVIVRLGGDLSAHNMYRVGYERVIDTPTTALGTVRDGIVHLISVIHGDIVKLKNNIGGDDER